jgi:hypothetical protein
MLNLILADLLHLLAVHATAMHGDIGECRIHFTQVFRREVDVD